MFAAMYMAAEMDAGDMIATRRTPIDPNENAQSLLDRLANTPGPAVTGSIGLTYVCGLDFAYDDCLRRADLALYQSKRQGKNRFRFYEDPGGLP